MAAGIKASADGLYGTLQVNSADVVTFNNSGNVGIGTLVPTAPLHVNSASNPQIKFGGSSAAYYWALDREDSAGDFAISNANGGAETERMRINASGNVGIGTSSIDAAKLHVAGASSKGTALFQHPGNNSFGTVVTIETTGGTDDPALSFKNYNGGSPVYYSIAGTDNGSLAFNSGGGTGAFGTERARIDSSGNLLVGRTTQFSDGQYSADFSGIAKRGATYNNTAANTGANFVSFGSSGTVIGTISQASGSTVSYATSSDYRLKEDISPMIGALAIVATLKPVTYKWKSDGSNGQGFIAHELQSVAPDCVVGEKDAVDSEGNPQYQGIDTSFLVATLTAAIQELKAIVDAQGAEIAALKSI